MANLVAYGMLSTSDSALAGSISKAQCNFCFRKYGSLEEARRCEQRHIKDAIEKEMPRLINAQYLNRPK